VLAFALALAGAVTLWLPAFRFRIDAVACAAWPPLDRGALYALVYVAAVALLATAWLLMLRRPLSLSRLLLLGAVVHAVAIVAPPFASNDALYYAAIGRAQAQFHAAPTTALSRALPPDDRILNLLPPAIRDGTSPYGPAFNELAKTIATVAGNGLTIQLRLYQLLAALAILLAAFIAGHTAGPRAAALVLFCPAAIVDGTINAHNDALLAPWFALFALALSRRREAAALAVAAGAVALKLSAVLLLGLAALRLVLRPLASRLTPSRLVPAGAVLAIAAVALVVAVTQRHPHLQAFTALFGDANEPYPRFSRSLEALPRAYLVYLAHQRLAAWIVGLAFRAAAGLWLLYAAFRAARQDTALAWITTGLFIYYLFLHAYLQTWYLIPLLPLAIHLPPRLLPPFLTFLTCLTLYYALSVPLDCDPRPSVIGAKEFCEAAIVFLPACFLTLRALRSPAADRASA
jgi:hypothetical protein